MSYILIFLILLLVCCICYFYYPSNKEGLDSPNNSNPSTKTALISNSISKPLSVKPVVPALQNQTQNDSKGILFLYPESPGFNVPDFGGFPDAKTVQDNFHTIAVIGNHAGNFVSQWNDPNVVKLQKDTGLPLVKWLAYYFGTDSSWACMCNAKGCAKGSMGGMGKSCNDCSLTVKKQISSDIQKYNITGIFFDDEEGDPTCIVQAMENVKDIFPNLQLGWTKSLGSAKATSPDLVGNKDWDVCLGQAYTDTTTDLYNGNCAFSPDFWTNVAKRYDDTVPANRGVPMVCGSGNCQEIDGCIDERMTGSQISALIKLRPPASQFKWRNFAIWYGTYANPSNCNKKTNKCCKTTAPECGVKCCDKWSM